jgi:hypothetical protein
MSANSPKAEAQGHAGSQDRLERLAELELIVERGRDTFLEVGRALLEIRDARLYRESHPTFEAYCRDRWGFTASRARQMIAAVRTVTDVTAEGLPAPTTEGAARRIRSERRAAVIAQGAWPKLLDTHGLAPEAATNGNAIQGVAPAGTVMTEIRSEALRAWRKSARRHADTTVVLRLALDATGGGEVLKPAERAEILAYTEFLIAAMTQLAQTVRESLSIEETPPASEHGVDVATASGYD